MRGSMDYSNDDLDFSGAIATPADDNLDTDLNVFEMAALGVGALIAVNGVAVCAAIAPAYTGTLLVGGGGLAYVGNRKRNDLPLNPFGKDGAVKVTDTPAPVAAPAAPAAAAEPLGTGVVVNIAGQPVDPATI